MHACCGRVLEPTGKSATESLTPKAQRAPTGEAKPQSCRPTTGAARSAGMPVGGAELPGVMSRIFRCLPMDFR